MNTLENDELQALSFVRRSLLKKNDKLKELSQKVAHLEKEVSELKVYKLTCATQKKEIDALKVRLGDSSIREERSSPLLDSKQQENRDCEENINAESIIKKEIDDDDQQFSPTPTKRLKRGVENGQCEQHIEIMHSDTIHCDSQFMCEEDQHQTLHYAGDDFNKENNQSGYVAYADEAEHLLSCIAGNELDESTGQLQHDEIPLDHLEVSCGSKEELRCNQCPFVATSLQSMARHCAARHRGDRRHSCPYCQYRGNLKHHVKRHVLRVHPEYPLTPCPQCSTSFVDPADLELHVSRAHTTVEMVLFSGDGEKQREGDSHANAANSANVANAPNAATTNE